MGTPDPARDKRVPLVSIGMPVWNCRRTLPAAIGSLLCQTYRRWELLVIDDGSIDGTPDIARSFADPRIRVMADGCHRKISARLNESIRCSRGEYYARMDGDDIAYPRRLEMQVAYLLSHPEVDVVGGSMLVFSGDYCPRGKRETPEHHQEICRDPIAGFRLAHPTFMGKLSWFRRHGYDETMSLIEDQELLLRTFGQSTFANVPDILLGYREDRINLRNNLRGRSMLFRLQGKHLARAGRWMGVVRSGFVHSSRASLYALFSTLGLMEEIMRLRARTPLTDVELQEWARVCGTIKEANPCAFCMS